MTRFAFFTCVILVFCEMAYAATPPRDTVERLHGDLLNVMRRAEELGIDGRYQQLKPVLPELFDFERMTAVVLGRHWRDASQSERRQAVEAFADFSIATYASRFDGYSGERFETLGEEPGPRGATFVSTRLIRVDEEPLALTYLLTQSDEVWRITDVFLRGTISETARLRSEFRGILEQGGLAGLIEKLDEKTRLLLDPSG